MGLPRWARNDKNLRLPRSLLSLAMTLLPSISLQKKLLNYRA
jgi:hypothetical protein